MQFDKPEHKQIVAELIRNANFPGSIVEMAVELKKAVEVGTISPVEPPHADPA